MPAAKKINKKAALREESIQRLSDAAFRVIVTKGYHAATLQEIAELVGMTKGAIFFYFASKEKLLLHLLDIAEANIVDSLFAHLAGIHGNALDKLIGYYHFGSKHGIDRPYQLLCLIQTSIEFRHRTDAIGKRITAIYARMYRVLEEIIATGKSRGVLKDVPTREFASMVIATHDGMMLEWYRRGKNQIDGRALVATVRRILLRGIAKADAASA
jgi:TetR/AcrR family transcriptional regulator, transcriptional repressor for nem operon